jgi:hypothetical protein
MTIDADLARYKGWRCRHQIDARPWLSLVLPDWRGYMNLTLLLAVLAVLAGGRDCWAWEPPATNGSAVSLSRSCPTACQSSCAPRRLRPTRTSGLLASEALRGNGDLRCARMRAGVPFLILVRMGS